jgi:galactose-1-phosphate uridylyltransferase
MARLELTRERLAKIVESWRMNEFSLADWEESFARELQSHGYLPDGIVTADPRTGDRVVFNAARARRPHDNRTPPGETAPPCIVCTAQLTRVLDVADLSSGFTFINKNLYPVVFPRGLDGTPADPSAEGWGTTGAVSYGLHLLQWTSSNHDLDWHNMPASDRVIVAERLASLERKLLEESVVRYPSATTWGGNRAHAGFVQIIKNSGAPVGGSVSHGHQQIILTNVMPRKTRDDLLFEKKHGERFARFILRENPPELLIRDYGQGVLLVPYFMRRPSDMLFVLRDSSKRFLHELDREETGALADGLHDGILLMRRGLESLGRHVAYNVVFHVGAGAGIYVEFLPYSQEVGGYEQSGYWSCQASPQATAGLLRSLWSD